MEARDGMLIKLEDARLSLQGAQRENQDLRSRLEAAQRRHMMLGMLPPCYLDRHQR